MKKLYLLLLALPLWTLLPSFGGAGGGRLLAAVQVQTLSADYANKRVTFSVSWAAGTRNTTHLSKVWVFVDYQPVTNPNTTGAWQRATVASATATTGTVSGNTGRGFFVQGTDGAFSSTVTVTLSDVPAKFNWCATATDYPPRVAAGSNGSYTFGGTPPFTLTAANGATQQVDGKTLAHSALTITPTALTDKTGCPGAFCLYTGSDLYIDATHICQQRTGGAQNWEAWIKDTRDNELYRIVLMPDNKWWLAQNVKYAGTGKTNTLSGCDKDKCGRWYTPAERSGAWGGTSGYGANKQGVCPGGWVIPLRSDWNQLFNAISPITFSGYQGYNETIAKRLQALNSTCSAGSDADYYGWASKIMSGYSANYGTGNTRDYYHANDDALNYAVLINHRGGCSPFCVNCNYILLNLVNDNSNAISAVRCFRTLQ